MAYLRGIIRDATVGCNKVRALAGFEIMFYNNGAAYRKKAGRM